MMDRCRMVGAHTFSKDDTIVPTHHISTLFVLCNLFASFIGIYCIQYVFTHFICLASYRPTFPTCNLGNSPEKMVVRAECKHYSYTHSGNSTAGCLHKCTHVILQEKKNTFTKFSCVSTQAIRHFRRMKICSYADLDGHLKKFYCSAHFSISVYSPH